MIKSGDCQAMQLLGNDLDVSDELSLLCEAFACRMYSKIATDNVNELRYRLLQPFSAVDIFATNPQCSGAAHSFVS